MMDNSQLDTLKSIHAVLQGQLELMKSNNARLIRIAEFIRALVKQKQLDKAMGDALLQVLLDE